MIKVLSALFVFLFCAATNAQDYQFIPGFEDIPQMRGLVQMEDGIISFDSAIGSFVEVHLYAKPKIKPEQVVKYYGEVLPALGWEQGAKANCFNRDGDNLCITFEAGQSSNEVVFGLTR